MSDFKSWEEVQAWLVEEGQYNRVRVANTWTISAMSLTCGNWDEEYGACCEDDYKTAGEAIESIKNLSDDNLNEVEKV